MQGFSLTSRSNRDDLHLHLVRLPRNSKAAFYDVVPFGLYHHQLRPVEPQRHLGFAPAYLGVAIPALGVALKLGDDLISFRVRHMEDVASELKCPCPTFGGPIRIPCPD